MGGHGRLSIGLYILFIEKWLEHFTPDQFLVVRLEDYELNPRQYMSTIFNFLGAEQPEDWTEILKNVHFNANKMKRDALFERTETLLRDFYAPFNALLAKLMDNPNFKWALPADSSGGVVTLRDSILHGESKTMEKHDQPEEHHLEATPEKSEEGNSIDNSVVSNKNLVDPGEHQERERAMHHTWSKARAGDSKLHRSKHSTVSAAKKRKSNLRGRSNSNNNNNNNDLDVKKRFIHPDLEQTRSTETSIIQRTRRKMPALLCKC